MTKDELVRALDGVAAKYVRCIDVFYRTEPRWRYVMKNSVKLAVSAAVILLMVAGFCLPHLLWDTEPKPWSPGAAVSGTKEELPTLRILIDLTLGGDVRSACREIEQFLLSHAEGCGESYQVEVESLPPIDEPDKREPAITQLHMQLNTGGPDVFLLRNFSDNIGLYPDLKNFFPYPASAMRQGVFLPLDAYIENDPNWENLCPAVMAAGNYEGSQLLVPLGFGIRASLVETASYDFTAELPLTGEQMLQSEDPVLRWAACSWVDMLGTLSDCETEELSFSEEELLSLIASVRDRKDAAASAQNRLPGVTLIPANDTHLNADSPDYWLIPSYNRSGGVTAHVEVFAAASAGTKYPREAYAVLKSLMSKEGQQKELITSFSLPFYQECQRGDPSAGGWYLNDWNYSQLLSLEEQINAVEFTTPLYLELQALFDQYAALSDEELPAVVHERYGKMQKMIDES